MSMTREGVTGEKKREGGRREAEVEKRKRKHF